MGCFEHNTPHHTIPYQRAEVRPQPREQTPACCFHKLLERDILALRILMDGRKPTTRMAAPRLYFVAGLWLCITLITSHNVLFLPCNAFAPRTIAGLILGRNNARCAGRKELWRGHGHSCQTLTKATSPQRKRKQGNT
jgi:hypothetical protein